MGVRGSLRGPWVRDLYDIRTKVGGWILMQETFIRTTVGS